MDKYWFGRRLRKDDIQVRVICEGVVRYVTVDGGATRNSIEFRVGQPFKLGAEFLLDDFL